MIRCLVSFSLCVLLVGCSRAKVERVEWTVMGTVAAIQTRGDAQSLEGVREGVQRCYDKIVKEFDVHDANSQIRLHGRCSPFGAACEKAAYELKSKSGDAFNPEWRGKGQKDFGAIAKGYAVDCAALDADNGEDVLIDLGGNLKSVRGSWQVGVAGSDAVITLTNGMACATSAEYFRGKHIYDGRTGLAVTNDVKSVTVVHPTSAMLADGLSTTLFVLGREKGDAFLERHYPEARAIWEMGRTGSVGKK